MERKECLICHEEVRVPVSFTKECFGCPQRKGQRWCYSTVRVCVVCARKYLQLNLPVKSRETSKKCLVCPKRCNPQLILSADIAYEKDFSYMSMDSKVYPCNHSSCSFRGTHHDIETHLQETCEFRCKICIHCKVMYQACHELEHRQHCPHYCLCIHSDCEEYVLRTHFHSHLYDAHHTKMCRHEGCHQLFPKDTDELSVHEERECPQRTVPCSFCPSVCTMSNYKVHLGQHIVSQQTTISKCIEETNHAHSQLERMLQIHRILMKDSLTWSVPS